MELQPAIFHRKALLVIRTFPKAARQALGEAVLDLQRGRRLGMPLSRPMPTVALGAYELRVRDEHGIYRAFYALGFPQGVMVFHAFTKKTRKTPASEIKLAKRRLKEISNA